MGITLTPKLYLSNQRRLWHWCPGCKCLHRYDLAQPLLQPGWALEPDKDPHSPKWTFNGNLELPSFSPSMLIYVDLPDSSRPWEEWVEMKQRGVIEKIPTQRQTRCHYFVTDGNIQYCSDSPHAYSGQTIPLPDLPHPDYYGYPKEP